MFLYSNGILTILGSSQDHYLVIDSILLFHNPKLFEKRLISLVQNKLNISGLTGVEDITFALTGEMDTKNKIIKKTPLSREICRNGSFDGYAFIKNFDKYIPSNKIHLINDAFATAIGVKLSFPELSYPAMVLSLHEGVGVSFIHNHGSISTTEWGRDSVPKQPDIIHRMLGRESLHKILSRDEINVESMYTQHLIKIIPYLAAKYEKENPKISSIFISGYNAKYINAPALSAALVDYYINVADDFSKFLSIVSTGCSHYTEFNEQYCNPIEKIQYFSGLEFLREFPSYDDLKKHFTSVKPLANPDNYYKIFRKSGLVEEVKIGSVKDVSELEMFRY